MSEFEIDDDIAELLAWAFTGQHKQLYQQYFVLACAAVAGEGLPTDLAFLHIIRLLARQILKDRRERIQHLLTSIRTTVEIMKNLNFHEVQLIHVEFHDFHEISWKIRILTKRYLLKQKMQRQINFSA